MKQSTREAMHDAFFQVSDGDRLAEKYSALYEAIEVGEWVQCKEVVARCHTTIEPQGVARMFKGLVFNGRAERREVDDGFVEVKRWKHLDKSGEDYTTEAFDKNGRPLGKVRNPYWGGCEQWVEETVQVRAHHAEFRLLPLK